jgi:hypothetical protein
MGGEMIFCKILLDALFDLLMETGSAGKSDFRHAFLSDVNSTLFIPKKKRGSIPSFLCQEQKEKSGRSFSILQHNPPGTA